MTAGTGEWTGLFGRSSLAPTVFDVTPDARPRVREWLAAQHVATAWTRDPHAPAVDAWAVADGGVLAVARWTPAAGAPDADRALPSGLYLVGFKAFRLLTAVLAVPRPVRPLPGEPLFDLDALCRAHRNASATCPDAVEQAELLATCTDRRTLRLVAGALDAAAHARPRVVGPEAVPPSPCPRDRPPAAGTLAG
ncbi:hypothetical protein LWC35_12285 [Pseudonocardia kujensis]|uniref:hypothetical protein n=1 Tax=Pseudonocardia kujensis TaxID=1128675 RepID=UPI001E38A47C|nr:hypothetical protein [Pseudonocardia kujensis]MCE0763678.1 hypothetical protein [Pseudonocardia kujensis]